MKTILVLLVSSWLFLPDELHAFYSIWEMKADALRKDACIKIKVHESGDQVRFKVAFLKAENPAVYWQGSLDLVDQTGAVLAKIELRGEDIRRTVDQETARAWGWETFRNRTAEVFTFAVDRRLLAQSKLWWELGPRNDERGVDYGGGVIQWCYLVALVEAANDANKAGAANWSDRIRSETNRTSSAVGSRR